MEYLVAFFFSILGVKRIQHYSGNFSQYLLAIQPIILLGALRTEDIGFDTSVYVFPEFYEACRNKYLLKYLNRYFANGYLLVNWFVSRVTSNVHIYLYIIHSIMYGSILYALYRLRDRLPVWIGMFFLCFVFYRESLNIARQFVALSFDILAFSFLLEKKWIKVLICTFIGYEFHHSALIFVSLISIYYLCHRFYKLFNRKVVKIATAIGVVIMLYSFSYIMENIFDYGFIDERYMGYTNDSKFEENIPMSQLTLYSVNLLFFYFVKGHKEGVLLTYFEYIVIISLILCFSALISTYTIRIMSYFSYMSIIIFPYLYCFNKKKFRTIHLCILVVYWFMTVVVANLSSTYPYKFYFN